MTQAKPETFQNADLLFDYIVGNYGYVLTQGGDYRTVKQGRRLVKLLSELTAETFEFWMNEIINYNLKQGATRNEN